MSNIQYERHTKAQLSPPLTISELASALLDKAEVEKWTSSNNRMIVDGKILGLGGSTKKFSLPRRN